MFVETRKVSLKAWTGSEALERLWRSYQRTLKIAKRSQKTIDAYRAAFNYFWSWANEQGHDLPDDVDKDIVNEWTEWMSERARLPNGTGVIVGEGTLSPNTVAIRWRNVRPFFSWWADDNDRISPFKRATKPEEVLKEPAEIKVNEVNKLIATCRAKGQRRFQAVRDEAIIRLLFDTGPRIGELAAMDLDDWDDFNDLARLDGKTGARVVGVAPKTAKAVAAYLAIRHDMETTTTALWVGDRNRGPACRLSESGMRQMLTRRCEQAGLDPLHFHLFRHNWADTWMNEGGDEAQLQTAGGWSSRTMPAHYSRRSAERRAQAAARQLAIGNKLK